MNLFWFFNNSIQKTIGASWKTGKKAQLWQIIEYLDTILRKELTLYENNTDGYERIIDMIIELHIMHDDSQLANKLIQSANDCLKFVS